MKFVLLRPNFKISGMDIKMTLLQNEIKKKTFTSLTTQSIETNSEHFVTTNHQQCFQILLSTVNFFSKFAFKNLEENDPH